VILVSASWLPTIRARRRYSYVSRNSNPQSLGVRCKYDVEFELEARNAGISCPETATSGARSCSSLPSTPPSAWSWS
jgi:hypothetical protein